MFNSDTINQLAKLKADIEASKDYGTGRVVGSNGRFGFVKLDDGRDAYLSPEKMQRLIPGDVIKVTVIKNDKDKLEANLEKLIEPALNRFVGEYKVKGKAHFVQPDGVSSARWLFVPPNSRAKMKDGDHVVAKLQSHPFKDGKAAVKVLEKIGVADENRFELKYIKAKYQLNREPKASVLKQAEEISKQFVHDAFGERPDLSDLKLVTIDSPSTRDMDDAIGIAKITDGDTELTRLTVAIADPSSFIAPDSPLARSAQQQAQTVYLLGGSVPMLPTNISHDCFSLEEGKKRPALVCQIDFDNELNIVNSSFEFALIQSNHKLSYGQVAHFLDPDNNPADKDLPEVPEDTHVLLKELAEFASHRRAFREQHHLVNHDQHDYDYALNDRGHIESVRVRPRTIAHQIVEESMLAANICAAKLLAQHQLGLCMAHPGFRPERIGEVNALLKEENIEHGDLSVLEEFVTLFHRLGENESSQLLIPPLKRMLASAELSESGSPHLNMGFEAYATITSPIRRYADLFNHWALRAIIQDQKKVTIKRSELDGLKDALIQSRQADRELYQWLQTIFAESLIGTQAQGKIRIVTQQGFGVKLDDTGLEGFVLFPKGSNLTFDAKRMTLQTGDETYRLEDTVTIKISSVDQTKKRVAFELGNRSREKS